MGTRVVLAFVLTMALLAPRLVIAADQDLTVDQLVDVALEANPRVHAARARWQSALHSIKQNYAPADPQLTYYNVDSPTNGFDHAAFHEMWFQQQLQFPGKAILQARQAIRNAEIGRLMYDATIRDVRAQTETAYYQTLLDGALADITAINVDNLRRVMKVTEVAYAASRVTQTDFIAAEFEFAVNQQLERQYRVSEANDKTTVNQLLYRNPAEALPLARTIKLERLAMPLDELVDRAYRIRQEILEAALTAENSETAITLAKLEFAPDYQLTYWFDNFLISSGAPAPTGYMQDHTVGIQFNVPLYFWLHQNEDIKKAKFDLEAAHNDLNSIKNQTAAMVTTLYRSTQFAHENAQLYSGSLIPLAQQDFEVAVIAYESGKVDFQTLLAALRRSYNARVSYLQSANQFLAGKVAIEQAIGAPLPK